jgi:predicted RNA-binding protein
VSVFPVWLLICATLFILLLLGVAIFYLVKLFQQNKKQQHLQHEQQTLLTQKRHELATDIQFIANAMAESQCEITEGCLRIASLMKALDDNLRHKPEFAAIFRLYEQSRELATHTAYQQLTAQERFRQDKKRLALEDELGPQVLQEAKLLSQYRFEILFPH